ncbi:MAG TPA: tetratricopeptide repeat protein [Dongiaceae bacterium]
MPVIMGGVIVLLQLTVVYHAFRNRRPYYWIFVIMAFPALGALVYVLVEVLPGSRSERNLRKIGNDIVKALNPDRAMKRRAEELAICGSVENKLKLAEELVERGMFDEAIHLYESAREGQYLHAPDLLYGMARARFFNGDYLAARKLLGELQCHEPRYYAQEVALMRARAAARFGDRSTARGEIESLLDSFVGLEARYRYAEVLFDDGQATRARTELERVIDHARRFKVSAEERVWARLARQGLAALGNPA